MARADGNVLDYLDACMGAYGADAGPVLATESKLVLKGVGKLTGALNRWAGLGPYYAMFPMNFAMSVVRCYCPAGGAVLDPFAGRGTSIFAASASGRRGVGIEVHPAGWIYGQTKLTPAPLEAVLRRLAELGTASLEVRHEALRRLPEFFHWCFNKEVLRFLVKARHELDWRRSVIDRTLTAFLLNYLHNSNNRGLSNQMHQAKSMAPDYSVAWWKRQRMKPPRKDPVLFLGARIAWRYRYGHPHFANAMIYHADSLQRLPLLTRQGARFDFLFTSPPYFSVANYHSDQWLRLWLLGGPSRPRKQSHISTGSFDNFLRYQELLIKVFQGAAAMLSRDAAVYVRTDAREQTLLATADALALAFPRRAIRVVDRPFRSGTQTILFGDKKKKPGEVDLVISRRR